MTRLKFRELAFAVMVTGLALGIGLHLRRRAATFGALAAYHNWAALSLRNEALGARGIVGRHLPDEILIRYLAPRDLIVYHASQYHAALKDKYSLAASQPWHVVAPDPPPPPFYESARSQLTTPAHWKSPLDSKKADRQNSLTKIAH